MSVAVITYNRRMSRWEPNARGRLEQAALVLYRERGFDQTTVAEIAERAGLTERTFFRYYADKREVLFWGQERLREIYVSTIAAAPASTAPIDAVAAALEAATPVFRERHELARQRQAVIAANPELRERELAKLDDYAAAVAAALRQRGAGERQATLAAEAGMTVLRVALQQWASGQDDRDLATVMRDSVAELRALAASG
jgi:AcrR family transcriptional regulator